MPRAVTIRQSLIRSFAPVVLAVAVAAFALLFFAGRFAVRTLSAELIDQTYARVQERLDAFFEPVLIEIEELAADAEAGLLAPEETEQTRKRLFRVVSSVPHVSLAIVADTEGREITTMLNEDASHWFRVCPDGDTDPYVIRYARSGQELERIPGPEGYRSTERPWHRAAVAAGLGTTRWTEPYRFYTTNELGITISKMVEAPNGERLIVAMDVSLSELDEFTRSLTLQKNGQAFLVDRDGRILGLPASPEYKDPVIRESVIYQRADSIGNRLLLDAQRNYLSILAANDTQEWPRPYRFTSAGHAYWGQVTWREYPGGLVITPAIIVAEKDLLGPIIIARWISLALGIAAIAFALWRCARVASRFSGPIEELANESDRIASGAQTIDHQPVASPVLELAKLSSSQVEMRYAMKTLGKLERDLQVAREIQEALLPTELPKLDDWSFAVWSDPADETGGDIYDIAQINGRGDVFMLLADATGHGVGPAISVAQVRAMARMALRTGANLRVLIKSLNAQLCEDLPAGRFITLWAARLEPDTGTLFTLSAGQAPLLYYIAAEDRFENRDANDLPLGIVEETEHAEAHQDTLAPGDFYAVFSDGIFEARSPEGEFFGTDRVIETLRAAKDGTAQDAMNAVRTAVEHFVAGQPATDDCTGVIIKRN